MAEAQRSHRTRWQKTLKMDREIIDVAGAADILGVSKTTIYKLAREGTIPATRIGREWPFSRTNLIDWIKNGIEADQLAQGLTAG